jgi:predicted dehydrogenase
VAASSAAKLSVTEVVDRGRAGAGEMPDAFGIGIAGFGYWGVNLARNVGESQRCELVAIADPSAERRQHAASRFPGTPTYDTLEALLAQSEVRAVLLATPPSTHAELAIRILNSGRHVLVEKPFATSTKDAERIIEAAGRNHRVAMAGHTFLYSPAVRLLRNLVVSGELGDIQYIYSQRLSLGRIRRDCNVLWNLAPHDVSIVSYLLSGPPDAVSATGHAFVEPPNEDVFFITTTATNGPTAFIHVSWVDPSKTRRLTVVGDRKMAVFDDVSPDQKVQIFDAGVARSGEGGFGEYESFGDFQWRTRSGDVWIPRVELTEPLGIELDDFVTSCVDGGEPLAGAASGLEVVRVLEAAERSAACGGSREAVGAP